MKMFCRRARRNRKNRGAVMIIAAACLFMQACSTGRKPVLKTERDFQTLWCKKEGGIVEYVLKDRTRVDCLTSSHAVEVDFAPKWAESIGQSLYYATMTGRRPGVLLIMKSEGDKRHLKRLNTVADKTGIKVWTITPKGID